MNNKILTVAKDKTIKKRSFANDREAIALLNKYFKKFGYEGSSMTMKVFKIVGNWIKNTISVRDVKESELIAQFDYQILLDKNSKLLLQLCQNNDVSGVEEKLNDPEFIFDPFVEVTNNTSKNSLLFTANKNHSSEILNLLFSKTDLKVTSFDNKLLKNCEVDSPELGRIASYYANFEAFDKALEEMSRFKPETFNKKTVQEIRKKQTVFFYL